jgi:hypothetical protein
MDVYFLRPAVDGRLNNLLVDVNSLGYSVLPLIADSH